DVIGHIGYTRRYMKKAGFDIVLDDYTDRLEAIFRRAAASGRGIEVNTSGIRQGLSSTIPDLRCVKLYRQCGGEIITVGSDAHEPGHIAYDFRRVYGILKDCGFDMQEQKEVVSAIAQHRTAETAKKDDLAGLIYRADKKSRPCLFCRAEKLCNWDSRKKNLNLNV
ncbi:MAG: hypothetical protein ACI4JB_09585, partial [Porcipelethomonas sp.]